MPNLTGFTLLNTKYPARRNRLSANSGYDPEESAYFTQSSSTRPGTRSNSLELLVSSTAVSGDRRVVRADRVPAMRQTCILC